MFVGTCSDAGKSFVNSAFCRIFKQDGYNPAPFKAQNMSLNSFSTPDGREIGRAQAVQAEACGLEPHTDMNPVLLKPTSDSASQVVLNGRPEGNMSARDYFKDDNKQRLFDEALAAFHRLEERHSPIVLEGAGSISELNLRERDITNMNMARAVGAATYLVADIDRGGVFASVYGSVMLLPEEERALLKGIIINKFRGDVSLFDDGRRIIKELTGIPVVGVLPYLEDVTIENEDSVALASKEQHASEDGRINVAVVKHRHISNFTDFAVMERDERFHLYYTNEPAEILRADVVILPGSKNTMADLEDMWRSGVAEAVIAAFKAGHCVFGICGGYQMMGRSVADPHHTEGSSGLDGSDGVGGAGSAEASGGSACSGGAEGSGEAGGVCASCEAGCSSDVVAGLGILPIVTELTEEKVTRQRRFHFGDEEGESLGYEIHTGVTTITEGSNASFERSALNKIIKGDSSELYNDEPHESKIHEDGEAMDRVCGEREVRENSDFIDKTANIDSPTSNDLEGFRLSERCWGTYMHGIFDNAVVLNKIASLFGAGAKEFDYKSFREEQYDKLADYVRSAVDMDYIYETLKL